jgi:prevent-host-death family protein
MEASMRTGGAREANQQFSRILRAAENGEEIEITRNGQPVARIIPVRRQLDEKQKAAALKRMRKLMEKGLPLGGRRWSRDEMHDD